MGDLDRLIAADGVDNLKDLIERVRHLETLEGVGGAVVGTGLRLAIETVTADYTILLSDHTILADATAAAITTTLPTAASAYDATLGEGYIFNVVRINGGGNAVTIDGNGAETISGSLTAVLSAQWDSYTVQSNGSNWFIL